MSRGDQAHAASGFASGDVAVADTIEKWIAAAAQILNDAPASVPLRLPCPACSKLWTYSPDGNRKDPHLRSKRKRDRRDLLGLQSRMARRAIRMA